MTLQPSQLRSALASVVDSASGKDIVTAGLIKDIQSENDSITILIESLSEQQAVKDALAEQIEFALRNAGQEHQVHIGKVTVTFAEPTKKANGQVAEAGNPLPEVNKVIAVGAGKGGVGKSTISTLLSIGLARKGFDTGLLDGDIYGPSMTTMLGLETEESKNEGQMLLPFETCGIKAMTIGKLVEPERALIWRGPRAHSAFNQLATQTKWGKLDHLIVDLPPGTGDVPLSLAQLLPLTGAIIVCTPQVVAQDDARRAIRMFQQLGVAVLGLVENMSYFIGDDGKEYDLFGKGGGEQLAAAMNIEFLGSLPIHPRMRVAADSGTPLDYWSIDESVTEALDTFVENVIRVAEQSEPNQPTLTINS
ncbi:MAG: Mrp/NBP35 family ATP-binding protein [Planctomycetota bacterium]|nr:Mrp/NBP35 family ATP-binding protein [Planctomycetota bacterium]